MPSVNQNNHVRFTVACISLLTIVCAVCATYLLSKGYQGGELLAGTASTGVAGLIGMLSMRTAPTTQSGAVATEVTNPQNNPVQTHDATA